MQSSRYVGVQDLGGGKGEKHMIYFEDEEHVLEIDSSNICLTL